jgi:PPOX class probable F420-dependent enzyme
MRRSRMIDPEVRALAQGANHAVVTTVMPDGSLQSALTWVDVDDEHVLVNTELDRQRTRNVQRDPRVTVLIIRDGDWYHIAEVRGRVVDVIGGDRARAHIDELSHRYTGGPYAQPIASERVILKVVPERQRVVKYG